MSVTDAIGRITQIQATLVQLDGMGKAATTTGSAATPASSSSAMAMAGSI